MVVMPQWIVVVYTGAKSTSLPCRVYSQQADILTHQNANLPTQKSPNQWVSLHAAMITADFCGFPHRVHQHMLLTQLDGLQAVMSNLTKCAHLQDDFTFTQRVDHSASWRATVEASVCTVIFMMQQMLLSTLSLDDICLLLQIVRCCIPQFTEGLANHIKIYLC